MAQHSFFPFSCQTLRFRSHVLSLPKGAFSGAARLPLISTSIIFLPSTPPTTEMGGREEYVPGCKVKVRFRRTSTSHFTIAGPSLAQTTTVSDFHNDGFDRQQDQLILGITHAYDPFTMAVVCRSRPMSIEYTDRNNTADDIRSYLPAECILKLYDRRRADNIRAEFDDGKPYTEEKESAYQKYLLDPNKRYHDFVADLFCSESGSEDSLEDGGAFEAYIAHQCERMWEKEVQAYEKMRDLQDELIPRLLGVVEYDLPVAVVGNGVPKDRLVIKGVLLEYIPAITLKQYITYQLRDGLPIDHDAIAHVCEEAVALVNTIGDHGVLNEDIRLDNILVRIEGEVPNLGSCSALLRRVSQKKKLPVRCRLHLLRSNELPRSILRFQRCGLYPPNPFRPLIIPRSLFDGRIVASPSTLLVPDSDTKTRRTRNGGGPSKRRMKKVLWAG